MVAVRRCRKSPISSDEITSLSRGTVQPEIPGDVSMLKSRAIPRMNSRVGGETLVGPASSGNASSGPSGCLSSSSRTISSVLATGRAVALRVLAADPRPPISTWRVASAGSPRITRSVVSGAGHGTSSHIARRATAAFAPVQSGCESHFGQGEDAEQGLRRGVIGICLCCAVGSVNERPADGFWNALIDGWKEAQMRDWILRDACCGLYDMLVMRFSAPAAAANLAEHPKRRCRTGPSSFACGRPQSQTIRRACSTSSSRKERSGCRSLIRVHSCSRTRRTGARKSLSPRLPPGRGVLCSALTRPQM